jgi:NAD(P)-dependent dehydrogenase (short-subunit alcohol dehydrogenase family)
MIIGYIVYIVGNSKVVIWYTAYKVGNIVDMNYYHKFNLCLVHIYIFEDIQAVLNSRSAYAASKHALHAFSDSLRAEVARYNIKVSVIGPAYIATQISVNALTGSGEVHGSKYTAIVKLHKLGNTTASLFSLCCVCKCVAHPLCFTFAVYCIN